jgi:alpha,alpha-trehalase
MLLNFLDIVDRFGFVPNGNRVYYLNRSQPPFLTLMVKLYIDATGDKSFLTRALPTLDNEYAFWIHNTSVTITADGQKFELNRYNVINSEPRPESYREDYLTAENTTLSEQAKSDLYADLATAAESGWDFGSRWLTTTSVSTGEDILRGLRTRQVIPIDLNTILYMIEVELARFHDAVKDSKGKKKVTATFYRAAAKRRFKAINTLMWDSTTSSYYDFNLTSNALIPNFSLANVFPYW